MRSKPSPRGERFTASAFAPWALPAAVLLVAAAWFCVPGCGPQQGEQPPARTVARPEPPRRAEGPSPADDPMPAAPIDPDPDVESRAASAPPGGKIAKPLPDDPEVPLQRPQVFLTEAHAKSCRVKVGDVFPDVTLPDVAGAPQDVRRLGGEELTVVVFWSERYVFAKEQFDRLAAEVADRYREHGVNVVAIHVGTPGRPTAAEIADATGFANLLDADSAAFGLVATHKLPRTYLLDATGRVLWFDLEYSRGMRRDLDNAIRFFLRPTT
jgi:peroxiredoxin